MKIKPHNIISVILLSFLFFASALPQHIDPIAQQIKKLSQISEQYSTKQISLPKELLAEQKLLIQSFSKIDPETIPTEHFCKTITLFSKFSNFLHLHAHRTTLLTALKKLADIAGFVGLMKILILSAHQPSGFYGYLYELEKGLQIHQEKNEEELVEFQKRICIPELNMALEFDIVTTHRIIECKNVNWNSKKPKQQFLAQKKIVDYLNKTNNTNFTYEVCSKKPIPTGWQNWFKNNNIAFSSDKIN